MADLRLTFIFLLNILCVITVNCDKNVKENLNEFYRPQIWSLVNYLNSNPDRVYNYNYATLISAQNKDVDNTDLVIEVEVNCHRLQSGLCITNKVICKGIVIYNTEKANYETLPGTTCAPKVYVDLSRDDANPNVEEERHEVHHEEVEAPTEVDLTHEVTNEGNVSGEQFIAVRPNSGFCLGCPVDVNTNVEGLDFLTGTALKHIETERSNKQALVRILRVQQQVVSGIKYIILIEVSSTICPKNIEQAVPNTCLLDTNAVPEICEITYFQQPWISKNKHIISNNCTESQEFTTAEETHNTSGQNGRSNNDLDNEIDVNYGYKKPVAYPTVPVETGDNVPNYDSIADTGHADDILKMSSGGIMDPSHMKEVESQIVYRNPDDPTPAMTTEGSRALTDEQRGALDDFLGMMGDQPREKRSPHHDGNNNNNDDDSSSSSSSSDEDDKQDHKQKKKAKHHQHHHDDNDNNKNNNNDDDSSSSSSSSEEDNNNADGKIHKSKRNRRDALHTSLSVSDAEVKKTKLKRDTSSKPATNEETQEQGQKQQPRRAANKEDNTSSSSSEEQGTTTGPLTKKDQSISSSEEHKDNRAKRETKSSEEKDDSSESNEAIENKEEDTEMEQPHERIEYVTPIKQEPESDELLDSEEVHGGVRRKRSVDSTSPLVKVSPDEKNFVSNLADFSVMTLDDIDADSHKRVVLQILGAKKSSDDDGILYYLTLRVGVSHCTEEKPRTLYRINLMKQHKPDSCRDNLFENLTKICKVQVHVTNEKTLPHVVKSHCQNIKKDDDGDTDRNRTHRLRRAGGAGVPGGVSPISTNDPKIQNLARELLQKLDSKNGVTTATQLIEIKSATKQVVAGFLYKFKLEIKESETTKICDCEVWERSWLPESKEVKIKCDGETEQKKFRYRRSEQQIGGNGDDHDIHMGLFKHFVHKYNKTYDNKSEYKKRFRIFRSNMKIIQKLNEGEQGTAIYGPTMFADMAMKEYKKHLGLNPTLYHPNNIPYPKAVIPDIELPTEMDWRTKGVVSEVKNQGQCGSCWAFSVTGNVEGQYAIKSGKLLELSEQELVDCDKLDDGCNGGLPDNAYRAIEQLGGLETESDYPYEAENEKCHFNKSLSKVQISGAVNISSDETDMAKWLVQNGPISIGINANAMQFYMGGVSHPWKMLCDPKNLDHGVLVVGYGTHKYPLFNKVLPYWIIKNSWGPNWGEQGYYRVYRGDGTCGVNQMASSAVL